MAPFVLSEPLVRAATDHDPESLPSMPGHAQGGALRRAQPVVLPDPLHDLEEQPRGDDLGEEVEVLTVVVTVVEDRVLTERLEQLGRQVDASFHVVVVVTGDGTGTLDGQPARLYAALAQEPWQCSKIT